MQNKENTIEEQIVSLFSLHPSPYKLFRLKTSSDIAWQAMTGFSVDDFDGFVQEITPVLASLLEHKRIFKGIQDQIFIFLNKLKENRNDVLLGVEWNISVGKLSNDFHVILDTLYLTNKYDNSKDMKNGFHKF